MATLARCVVQVLAVVRDPLVPNNDSAGLVADAAREVLSTDDMVEEELEKVVRLLLIEADDALGVDRVHLRMLVSRLTYCGRK